MSSGGRGPRLASDPHKSLNPHKPQASWQQLPFLMFYPIYFLGLLQVENMKTFEKACKSTLKKKQEKCQDYDVSDYCSFCGQDFKMSGLGTTVWFGGQLRVG